MSYISEWSLKDLVCEFVGDSALSAGVISHVLKDRWPKLRNVHLCVESCAHVSTTHIEQRL